MSKPTHRGRRPAWLLALAALSLLAAVRVMAEEPPPGQPGAVAVKFTDGSVLKLTLADPKVEVVTPYGRLSVPITDIQKIDFATRLTEEATKRIEEAIPNLGHPQFGKREVASAELLKLREKAYPALLEAAKSKDPEVAHRATELLERIRTDVPAENLEIRKFDVIQTPHSKFSGKIDVASLKAVSTQFGDVQLKLTDMRSLSIPGLPEEESPVVHAEPDPGSLTAFNGKIGETFHFRVTGATNASIWGTDVYTTDSQLATVAVHAGVLKAGQTGVVKVTILASPQAFTGSSRNDVTSNPYGPYTAAYKVRK
jgi:hypothetical protein